MTVFEPFNFPRYIRNFIADSFYLQTLFTCCIDISNPLNIYAGEPRQAGEACFCNSEMLKKSMVAQVKKSTEWHLRLPYFSPPLFPTIENHCSLHYYLSLQVGSGMCRKLHSMFSALNFCLHPDQGIVMICTGCLLDIAKDMLAKVLRWLTVLCWLTWSRWCNAGQVGLTLVMAGYCHIFFLCQYFSLQ